MCRVIFIWFLYQFIIPFYIFSQQRRDSVSYNDVDIVLKRWEFLYAPVASDSLDVQYEAMDTSIFPIGITERTIDNDPKDLARGIKSLQENRGGVRTDKKQKDENALWRKQLDLIMRGGYNGLLDSSDLSLISYALIDREQGPTLAEFKDMPVQIIRVNNKKGIPIILKLSEKSKISAYYDNRKQAMIDYYDRLDADLRLVKLEWSSQQIEFYTYCIISEAWGKLVYDDILSNAFIVEATIAGSIREHSYFQSKGL